MPVIVLIMLAVTVAVQLFLSLTKHGRRMYAIGGNPEAARLSGIRTVRYRVAAYVISSWLAALGGILLASRIGSSQVNAGGGYLMDAVAAAYIGFSLAGAGKPNALGTLIGAVLLGVLQNGTVMLSVPYYAMDIIKGRCWRWRWPSPTSRNADPPRRTSAAPVFPNSSGYSFSPAEQAYK